MNHFCIIDLIQTHYPNNFCVSGDVQGLVGRANADSIDLNRNFPSRFDEEFANLPDTDPRKASRQNLVQEPETMAVIKWLSAIPFVLSANHHGGSLVANYPFDDTETGDKSYSMSPDNTLFRSLAETYANVDYFYFCYLCL